MGERLLIVGGDAGGMSAAAIVRRRAPDVEVVAFDRGAYTSYSRCGIPYYVAGLLGEVDTLVGRSPEKHRAAGIEVNMRHDVAGLDLDRREVTVRDLDARSERREGFDQLVYAAGAEATLPPVPGVEACEPVRSLEGAARLAAQLEHRPAAAAVVIGASYIGLEMAEALIERGMRVTLIDQADQVFGSLDPDIAAHVQDAAEGLGIDVVLATTLQEVQLDADGRPRGVVTADGAFPADHVVLATGVKPVVGLARDAGLTVDETGALRTDDHQRCEGADGVYAAGDCVSSWHRILQTYRNIQLGTHANKQGRVAGTNIAGGEARFPGVIGTAISRVCKYEVARTGISEREAGDAGIAVVAATVETTTRAGYFPGTRPMWVKLVAEPGTGRLLGAQIMGGESAGKRIDVLALAVWTEMAVGDLELVDLSYAPPFSGVYDPVLIAARACAGAVAKAG